MSNSIIVAAMTSPNLQESRPDAVGAAMEIEVNDVIPLAHAYTAFRVGVPIGRTNRKKRDRFQSGMMIMIACCVSSLIV